MNGVHCYNKVILMLMIKNESNIIIRCIDNAIKHVDAVCILDTGSTDNTVELCNTYLLEHQKPFKISVEPFKNFGYNRSISFIKAQELCQELEWDLDNTYAMAIDADMNIVVTPSFKYFNMTSNGYTAIQKNGNIKYFNTRLMKLSYPWKCIGVTHEYWSGTTEKIPIDIFYINDKNDGGCKSDKFMRDISLLTEDIKNDPNNGRSQFYLARSLKDFGRYEEAITVFKTRIGLGGFLEEIFYAHYEIGKCYCFLKNEHEMELWMNKAFDMRPSRAEPLYFLTRYFREHSQHYKAYHYYDKGYNIPFPKNDVLFIEYAVYEGLFDYENTILACYINKKTKHDSLHDVITYINKNIPHHIHNVWDNIIYYIDSLNGPVYNGEYSKLLIKDYQQYKVSSCCLIPYSSHPSKRFLLNARYVNYSINSNGSYHIRDADGHVRTKNGYMFLNESYQPTADCIMMNEEYTNYNSDIEGLEDVRLYYHNGKLSFTSSSKNCTDHGRIMIVSGDYIPEQNKMTSIHVLEGPKIEPYEKNWIYVNDRYMNHISHSDKQNFIYKWNPLEIGAIHSDNKLHIHTTYPTPNFFSHCRGSSPLVEYNYKVWAVVHFVKYCTPRKYYHSVVQFNRDTMKPEAYSLPFSFCEVNIEYCIGFHIHNDIGCFIFSCNDADASMIKLHMNKLHMNKLS